MGSSFTAIRSQATQVEARDSAPTGEDVYEGRVYFDTSTGRLYAYVNSAWRFVSFNSTSTSTSISTSSSTSTTSTSTSSTSTSSTSTSTSSTSSSTSTTLY